jgi:ABC-type thiamine transport system ATPase subunit
VGVEGGRRIADGGMRIGLGREGVQQPRELAGGRGRQRVARREGGQRFA